MKATHASRFLSVPIILFIVGYQAIPIFLDAVGLTPDVFAMFGVNYSTDTSWKRPLVGFVTLLFYESLLLAFLIHRFFKWRSTKAGDANRRDEN